MNCLVSFLLLVVVGWALPSSVASAFVCIQVQQGCRSTDGFQRAFGLRATSDSNIEEKLIEDVWRYVKKPLVSVGAKGANEKHGNSLRQLLNDHTAVKVKVNTKSFGTLEKAYERLRELTVESGASEDIELIQMREKDRTILFGLPGTFENMRNGSFPPVEDDDDDDDDVE
mmetsp:Transcript_16014/g.36929  ORF Transcript_16014/g.36929 Transcript_16014/m.36929 type:complete len:171 (+) Transcript_16014:134-646(+)